MADNGPPKEEGARLGRPGARSFTKLQPVSPTGSLAVTDRTTHRGILTDVGGSSDPKLKSLSPKARDLLERILTAFPHETLFGSGVNAAPAQLRLTCYHSDDTRLDPDIGRQLKELELNSIGILRRVSRKTRLLTLTLDFSGAHETTLIGTTNLEARNPGSSYSLPGERSASVPNTTVIHNSSGRSPPFDQQKIAVVVATATDPSDFCTRARGLCPGLNLVNEWNFFVDHRKKIGRPATLEKFAETWLPRAQRQYGKITKPKKATTLPQTVNIQPQTVDDQPDLFDEHNRATFLRQYEERKARLGAQKSNAKLSDP